jgi:hypothetical protein
MSIRDWWTSVRRADPGNGGLPTDHPPVGDLLFDLIEARGDLVWSMTGDDGEGRLTLGLVRCPPQDLAVLVDDHQRLVGLRLSRSQAQAMHRAVVGWLADPTAPRR